MVSASGAVNWNEHALALGLADLVVLFFAPFSISILLDFGSFQYWIKAASRSKTRYHFAFPSKRSIISSPTPLPQSVYLAQDFKHLGHPGKLLEAVTGFSLPVGAFITGTGDILRLPL
jgi:hypothetical protein